MRPEHGELSVCALVPYLPNTTPSQRFRIEQWMPALASNGIEVTVLPFADKRLMQVLPCPGQYAGKALAFTKALAQRLVHLIEAAQYDAIFIHRAISIAGPALLERVLQVTGKPIIFDFDDAIFRLHTDANNRWFSWLKFPGKTAAICRLSSEIVVGNMWLADYARQFNPNVTVIPTSIDVDRYQPLVKNMPNSRVVVGWTGSATSQTYLEMFAPVLRTLMQRQDVELRVISNREPRLPGIPYVWRAWSPETEIAEISQLDIGLMPMPDDEWARGKCALKALQYMALGIPTICTAVGANCEVIQHGENGMLAYTDEEWLASLAALIGDMSLRQRLGDAGRRTIEQRYSMQHCAGLFAQVVRATIARKRVGMLAGEQITTDHIRNR